VGRRFLLKQPRNRYRRHKSLHKKIKKGLAKPKTKKSTKSFGAFSGGESDAARRKGNNPILKQPVGKGVRSPSMKGDLCFATGLSNYTKIVEHQAGTDPVDSPERKNEEGKGIFSEKRKVLWKIFAISNQQNLLPG